MSVVESTRQKHLSPPGFAEQLDHLEIRSRYFGKRTLQARGLGRQLCVMLQNTANAFFQENFPEQLYDDYGNVMKVP